MKIEIPNNLKKIYKKDSFKKITFNTFWLLSDRALRIVVTLMIGALTARYLDVAKFGIFNNALAYSTIFAALSTLGIDSIVIRDLVKTPERRDQYLGTALILKLISGLLSFIASLLGIFLFFNNYNAEYKAIILILSAGTIFQAFDVIDYYFQALTLSKYSVIARNLMFLVANTLKFILIITKADLILFSIVWLVELILITFALVYVYQKKITGILNWTFDRPLAKRLLSESWTLYLTYISAYLYMRVDQVIISKFLDPVKSGLFAASTKLYEIPFIIITLLTSSFFPSLVRIYDSNEELFYKRYGQITLIYSMMGLGIVILTLLFGRFAIQFIYGQNYSEAFPILVIQMIGMIFMFNAGLRSSYFTIVQKQKIIMSTTIVSAILNIVLNLLLVPKIGVVGAALATVITQFLSLFLLNILFSESKKIFIIQAKSLFLLNISILTFTHKNDR